MNMTTSGRRTWKSSRRHLLLRPLPESAGKPAPRTLILSDIDDGRTVGKSVSAEKYEEHVARLDVFRRWFDSNVMPVSLTDEPAVMILPYNQAKAKYRDRPQKSVAPSHMSLNTIDRLGNPLPMKASHWKHLLPSLVYRNSSLLVSSPPSPNIPY